MSDFLLKRQMDRKLAQATKRVEWGLAKPTQNSAGNTEKLLAE